MNSTAKLIIESLARDNDWIAYDGQLTLIEKYEGQPAMLVVQLNGRVFINASFMRGEQKWWPWTRRKIAKAAREAYQRITEKKAAIAGAGKLEAAK